MEIADASGIDSLSMRRLADDLDVQAMSLYNHVKNKEELTRAIIELAISEIDLSFGGLDWKAAMRLRAHSALEAAGATVSVK